jgi:hypothetical protein
LRMMPAQHFLRFSGSVIPLVILFFGPFGTFTADFRGPLKGSLNGTTCLA